MFVYFVDRRVLQIRVVRKIWSDAVALDVSLRQALENTLKTLWTDNITGISGSLRRNLQFFFK
jgi:hypothetical protein